MTIRELLEKYNVVIFAKNIDQNAEARKLTAKCRYFYSYYPPDEEKKRLTKR